MAWGFSPKYAEDTPFGEYTREQYFAIAVEAAKRLNWNIGQTSEAGFTAFTNISMSSWGEKISVIMGAAAATIKSECIGQILDYGKNRRNVKNLQVTIENLKKEWTPEEWTQKYEELKPDFLPDGQAVLNQTPSGKIRNILAIFKPTAGYFITPVIIDLNIFVFLLMALSGANIMLPDGESLVKWGADFSPLTLSGEWWRLLTCCFVHIGIVHLLMNMYALFFIGLLLEPYLGKLRFSAAYLLAGIFSSITSLWWRGSTVGISAGASGAIFGMYGVFLALLAFNIIEKSARKALLASIGIFVAYNLLNGVTSNGIDNAAHIGGLVSGFIIGCAFIPSLKKPQNQKLQYSITGAITVLIVLISAAIYHSVPNDIGKYTKLMNQFAALEKDALSIYNSQTPDSVNINVLETKGISDWHKSIQIIDKADKLNLPDELHNRNKQIIEYCNLRIKEYSLIHKATSVNSDSLRYYAQQINAILDSLNDDNK